MLERTLSMELLSSLFLFFFFSPVFKKGFHSVAQSGKELTLQFGLISNSAILLSQPPKCAV